MASNTWGSGAMKSTLKHSGRSLVIDTAGIVLTNYIFNGIRKTQKELKKMVEGTSEPEVVNELEGIAELRTEDVSEYVFRQKGAEEMQHALILLLANITDGNVQGVTFEEKKNFELLLGTINWMLSPDAEKYSQDQ